MAEMNSGGDNGSRHSRSFGKRRSLSTRVDLTPMVDLGFLLITFFVFTTSMNEIKAMRIFLPMDSKQPHETAESGALTLIADETKVWYYVGTWENASAQQVLQQRPYSGPLSIRNVILDLRRQLVQQFGNDEKMTVMLKATPNSQLKNTIDLLDEMLICDVDRYMMMDLSEAEQQYLDVHR